MNKSNINLCYSIGVSILFISLGFYLTKKEDVFRICIGYANIIFFSGLILFTLYKLIIKKQKNSGT